MAGFFQRKDASRAAAPADDPAYAGLRFEAARACGLSIRKRRVVLRAKTVLNPNGYPSYEDAQGVGTTYGPSPVAEDANREFLSWHEAS